MIKTTIDELNKKYYKTDCAECGQKCFGTKEQYTDELRKPDSQWRCLSCGTRGFVFDDDFHYSNMERITILNIYNQLTSITNIELAKELESYFSNRFEELMQSDGLGE